MLKLLNGLGGHYCDHSSCHCTSGRQITERSPGGDEGRVPVQSFARVDHSTATALHVTQGGGLHVLALSEKKKCGLHKLIEVCYRVSALYWSILV